MNKQFLLKTLPVFIALSMVLGSVGLLILKTEAVLPTQLFYSSFEPKTFDDWTAHDDWTNDDAGGSEM